MIARYRNEFVEDATPLDPPRPAVAPSQRCNQLVPRCHAHPSHAIPPGPNAGNNSGEAIVNTPGTILTRQCARLAPLSRGRDSLGELSHLRKSYLRALGVSSPPWECPKIAGRRSIPPLQRLSPFC